MIRLILAEQSGIDKDAGEVIADRLIDQHRRYGAVNAAGQCQQNLLIR